MGLNGGGYTFLNIQDLPQLTDADVQAMFADKSSFLLRVRHANSTQPYGVLEQLPALRYELHCIFSYGVCLLPHSGYTTPAIILPISSFVILINNARTA